MQMSKAHTLQLLVEVMTRHGAASESALQQALGRAEARAGLGRTNLIDEDQLNTLLLALASEGGRIQQVAETIASWRAESTDIARDDALESAAY